MNVYNTWSDDPEEEGYISDGERQMVTCVASTLGMTAVQGYDVPVTANCASDACSGYITAIVILSIVLAIVLLIFGYRLYNEAQKGTSLRAFLFGNAGQQRL